MDTDDLKRRIGKVRIAEPHYWDLISVTAIFNNCIILEVQHWDYNRRWVYTAVSPDFDLLTDGEAIPEYISTMTQHEDGRVTRGKWERIT